MKAHAKQSWILQTVEKNAIGVLTTLAITAVINMVLLAGNLWLTSKLSPLQTSINTLTVKAEQNEKKHEVESSVINQIVQEHATFKKGFDDLSSRMDRVQAQVQALYVHFLGR